MAQLNSIANIISKGDCKSLLSIIQEVKTDFEYLTPSMFSGLMSIAVLSYLRGSGYRLDGSKKGKERFILLETGIENLVDFSINNDGFEWFLDFLDKFQDSVNERELSL